MVVDTRYQLNNHDLCKSVVLHSCSSSIFVVPAKANVVTDVEVEVEVEVLKLIGMTCFCCDKFES
jgi:hypothetical protein